MNVLRDANSWRGGLWLAIGLFLLTRTLTLTAFPIFNDEAIYLQYSQLIHDDWKKNKFVSMNGEFTDWKPPLQYWMAAPVIRCGGDPLVAGRIVATFVSFLGLFGFYLFAKELFSRREAVIAAILYVVCPTVFFHNNQFTAETFLFSAAPFLYWSLLKGMQPSKWKLSWAILATLMGAVLLLSKQSGFLLLVVSIALPFARLHKKHRLIKRAFDPAMRGTLSWNWKELVVNLCTLVVVIVCSHVVANLAIPSEFNNTREKFNSHWVMSIPEILRFPVGVWHTNLQLVGDYIDSYYSWSVALFFSIFLWFAFKKKDFAELALASMCLAGAGAVIFLLRGFNEYLFNTSVIVVLLPVLARTATQAWNLARNGTKSLVRTGLIVVAGVTLAYWGYQIALMGISPGKYIERSTDWAVTNYLKRWSTGFGVKEVVTMLGKEKEAGVIFADTQWGNPQTALQVYGKECFPDLRIVPISREFLSAPETRELRDAARKMGRANYAIFSADSSEGREQWISNVEHEMCETRTEIKTYPGQMPIIVCRF